MADIKIATEANRKAWEEVAPLHRKQNLEPAFSLLDTAAKDATSKSLVGQPTSVNVRYYLTGANSTGEGPQGNTILVKL